MKRWIVLFTFIAATSYAGEYASQPGRLDWSSAFPPSVSNTGNHSVFTSAFQRWTTLREKYSYSLRQHYSSSAVAAGYSYTHESWKLGAAFSYEHGTRKYHYKGTPDPYQWDIQNIRKRSNTASITIFGGLLNQANWYLDASATVAFQKFNNDMLYPGSLDYKARESRTHFSASLETGKSFILGQGFIITPHLGVDFAIIEKTYLSSFTPPVPSVWEGEHQYAAEIPFGIRISKSVTSGCWSITPFADLGAVITVGRISFASFHPGFAVNTGTGWKTYGVSNNDFGGRIQTGVQAKYNERFTFGVNYTFEVRKDYRDHRISANFDLAF